MTTWKLFEEKWVKEKEKVEHPLSPSPAVGSSSNCLHSASVHTPNRTILISVHTHFNKKIEINLISLNIWGIFFFIGENLYTFSKGFVSFYKFSNSL